MPPALSVNGHMNGQLRKIMAYGDGTKPYLRSDGRWVARFDVGYTEKGTRRRKTVTGSTEAECKRRLRDAVREYRSAGTTLDQKITVKRYVDKWLANYQAIARPRTYDTDSGFLRKWVVPTVGNKQLSTLTADDMRKIDRAVLAAGRSPTTAHNVGALFRRVLKNAVQEGYRVPEAARLTDTTAVAESDRIALTQADAITILIASMRKDLWPELPADASRDSRTRRRLALERDPSRWIAYLLQGMRQGEALGLTWDKIDFDSETITVDQQLQRIPTASAKPTGSRAKHVAGQYWLTDVKTVSGRRVQPMVPMLRDALREWREAAPESPHNLVWPRASGGPMSRSDDLAAWKGLQEAAGVSRSDRLYVGHEARHTTASLLLALGVPDDVRVQILGHSSVASTHRYTHTDLTQARDALQKLSEALQPAPALRQLDSH